MPLSEKDIQQRRNMSAEARRDLDIGRIAEAMEQVADKLGKIQNELFQIRGSLPRPGSKSSFG